MIGSMKDCLYDVLPCDFVVQEGFPDYIDYNGITWARIREFGNLYYISELGHVVSFYKERGRVLSVWHNRQGHEYVQLYDCHGGRKCSVHRLVAEYFVPNPSGYPVVRHFDDVPDNNCYLNLEWGTQADNYKDMIRNGHGCFKSVYCYETDRYYKSCVDAAEDFGVSRFDITLCCSGKNHTVANRFHLCYVSDLAYKMEHLDEWLGRSTGEVAK